ncbi:MAG: tRNA pseudouridine(55) synthase TruB, partial [Deltaproteobacteria bacterium]
MSRRKGRKLDGWLLIDKPAGPTSADVVNKLRWAYGAAKAGHGGTLDPAATGLLVLAFGEATKCLASMDHALKTYRFMVRFGAETSTDDAEGAVLATSDVRPSDTDIELALAAFRGHIQQIPPQVSAVKVDGERAYDLAREGIQMELKSRPLWVERLVIVGRPDADHVELEMICGKGGYVRAIARDLGRALGTLGHALWLRRTAVGPFDLAQALMFAGSAEAPQDEALLPLEAALPDNERLDVTSEQAKDISHGRRILGFPGKTWAAHKGQAIALGHIEGAE